MKTETIENLIDLARSRWEASGRHFHGALLTTHNAKLVKTSKAKSVRVAGLSLWPGRVPPVNGSAGLVTCSHASAGCLTACLNFSGHAAAFPERVLVPRILRTWQFLYHREDFLQRVLAELAAEKRSAEAAQEELYFRPNIVSDLPWHTEFGGNLVQAAWETLGVRSYGYTKIPHNFEPGHRLDTTPLREFYRVVFSRSEENETHVSAILKNGHDVSVVFHEAGNFAGRNSAFQRLPETYTINGVKIRVIDGDAHDLRGFGDPINRGKTGRIIGLRLKGNTAERESAIRSGFSLPARTL